MRLRRRRGCGLGRCRNRIGLPGRGLRLQTGRRARRRRIVLRRDRDLFFFARTRNYCYDKYEQHCPSATAPDSGDETVPDRRFRDPALPRALKKERKFFTNKAKHS
jgi:hypothetical protein